MYNESNNNLKFDKGIIERLDQALHIIRAIYDGQLIEVSLFGSYARGTQRKYSSIDLIVVVSETQERFVKRNADLQGILNENDKIPLIDPLVYTEEEIKELLTKKESFLISAFKESVVIWDNFKHININTLTQKTQVSSKYKPLIPHLEEIEYD